MKDIKWANSKRNSTEKNVQKIRERFPGPDKTKPDRCSSCKPGSCAWQHCEPLCSTTGNSIIASVTTEVRSFSATHSCRSRKNSCRTTAMKLHLCFQVFPAIPVVPFSWPAHAVYSSSTIQPLMETWSETERNRETERKGKPWLGSPSLSRISGWASVRSLPVSCKVLPGQHQRLNFKSFVFYRNVQYCLLLSGDISNSILLSLHSIY